MKNKRNLLTALAIAFALCAVPAGHRVMSALAAESGNDVVTTVEFVSGRLDSLLEEGNKAYNTIDHVKGIVSHAGDTGTLRTAMNNDDTVVEKLAQIEELVKTNSKITVEPPAVSEAAKKYLDTSKITTVGAALWAKGENDSVQLSVDVKDTPAGFDAAKYGVANSITLDLKLKVTSSGSSSEERNYSGAPIYISMPMPAGLSGNIVIYHVHDGGYVETIYPKVSADGLLSFTVTGFSDFVFAEAPAGSTEEAAGKDDGSSVQDKVDELIESAAKNTTVVITKDMGVNCLSNSQMQTLVKRGNVTLKMEYVYQGREYSIVIPAGSAEDNAIEWYGPLYLAAHYSGNAVPAAAASGNTYQVQKGDTLSRIAAKSGTTVNHLKALNPQIKDINLIYPGWQLIVK